MGFFVYGYSKFGEASIKSKRQAMRITPLTFLRFIL